MTPVRRSSARVLVIDSEQRVLLLRGADPARPQFPIWHAPGGGIDPGETAERAARRELREEVGLDCDDLGPVVWTRRMVFSFDGTVYDQDEVYFVQHVDRHVVNTQGHTPLERRYLTGHGWFSVEAIRATSDLMAPADLAQRLSDLLVNGPPAAPVEVAGATLP